MKWECISDEKRSWGGGMVEAMLPVGKDHIVSIIAHKSVAHIVEAMIQPQPAPRQPLTDEQIAKLWAFEWKGDRVQFIRVIEAAHGINGDKP